MRVRDKVAVVTGGSAGIGEAIVWRLAEEGAKVAIIVDVHIDAARKIAQSVTQKGSECLAFQADVSNRTEVQAAIQQTLSHFGVIDILVNNAGIMNAAPVDEMAEETWDRVIDVNLKGYFLCAQAVIPQMKQRKYGKILNVSSRMALGGQANIAHYSASKAGVIGLTRGLATELAPFTINVNAVAPGATTTSLRQRTEEDWRVMAETIPLGRIGTPQDIANAVLFLASDEASYITGQCLYVCGGRSIAQANMPA